MRGSGGNVFFYSYPRHFFFLVAGAWVGGGGGRRVLCFVRRSLYPRGTSLRSCGIGRWVVLWSRLDALDKDSSRVLTG